MFTVIKAFLGSALSGLWGYLAAAGTAVLAILAVYGAGKKSGKTEVEDAGLKKEAENVQKANEVERKVDTAKPDAVNSELRNDWSRD